MVTAKANQLDPYAYLVHVARMLPSATALADVEALLPWNLTPETIAVS
ncbi:MAG: transposase [Gammaproteobacteria bacterium]